MTRFEKWSVIYIQIQSYNNSIIQDTNKTSSAVWSGRMDDDEEGRTSCANFRKGKYLEEYMVLNMKTGNGKVGRIEN
jgi:hypothetical protein